MNSLRVKKKLVSKLSFTKPWRVCPSFWLTMASGSSALPILVMGAACLNFCRWGAGAGLRVGQRVCTARREAGAYPHALLLPRGRAVTPEDEGRCS